MPDNEKLIEEAAAKRYPHRNVFLEGMAYMSEERSRVPLREAFAEGAKWRAEKAHTPTDDEREAQGWREAELYANADGDARDDFMTGWRTADRLRRSEVPERYEDKPDWPDHLTMNEKLRDMHARWHEQKGNLLGREECGYERCEFWDSAEFAFRLADVHIAGQEPQGEPSDAQEVAAARAIYGGDPAWGYVVDYGQGEVGAHWEDLGQELQDEFRHRARAALCAASEVGGEGR